jgi:hypothetical protein
VRPAALVLVVFALACSGSASPAAGRGADAAAGSGGSGATGGAGATGGGGPSGSGGATSAHDAASTTETRSDDRDGGADTVATDASDEATVEVAAPRPDGAATDASSWPAVADYGATGPFAVARDVNTGPGGGYDVFRPATLGAGGRRHPIVSWANGTLFSLSDYQKLLEHWASHGFVVIAGHTNSTAGGGTHKAGIDWLVAENARTGSPYFGLLDPAHVAAAGHSQGGGATIAAGAQKPGALALTTTLPLMPILSFESDMSIVGKQTAPMLNINATMDTRDPTGTVAMQIYAAAKTELVQAAFIGVHEDAMGPAMLAPTLAWLRLRLMADEQARPLFYPPDTCGLCRDPAWKQVRYRNVP